MRPLLDGALTYGVNLSGTETGSFLTREYALDISKIQHAQTPTLKHIPHSEYHAGVIQPGTVILTTSLKHARDLGSELRKIHGKNTNILIQ